MQAMWCSSFDTDKQSWSKASLLLATKTELSAEEILRQYARRWGIKPLFHYLNAGGMSQPVETETHCAGIRDADPLGGLDISPSVEPGRKRIVPHYRRGTVARQTTADRQIGSAVSAHEIFRACFQR